MTLWWAMWVILIVPGHTRGAVGVDGQVAQCEDGGKVGLFFSDVGGLGGCCGKKSDEGKQGKGPSADNCVLCKTVMNNGVVGGVVTLPVIHACVEVREWELIAQVCRVRLLLTIQGRAPPVGAC